MPLFKHKPNPVEASRLTRDQRINGRRERSGKWLILGIKDQMYVIDADVFDESYEPADEKAAEYYRRMTEEF